MAEITDRERDAVRQFLETEQCPKCHVMGRLELTSVVAYSAPLQYVYQCGACGHYGNAGPETMFDPTIRRWS